MNNIDRYAVMGNPIEHSKSPEIHQAFAKQCQQAMTYDKILVPVDGFEQAVREFQEQGGKGLNITLPFKQQAFALADECSERAKQAKAVNTFIFRDHKIIGDNTDGIGLVRDLLDNHHVQIKDRSILIIGASGAARGVIGPLTEQQPQSIHIANRTTDKAIALAADFKQQNITGSGFAELDKSFDILINATSASISNQVPDVPTAVIHNNSCCYDMYYTKQDTAFVKWGKANGARVSVDGFGMLVEQAAEAFYLWRGVRPDTVNRAIQK